MRNPPLTIGTWNIETVDGTVLHAGLRGTREDKTIRQLAAKAADKHGMFKVLCYRTDLMRR